MISTKKSHGSQGRWATSHTVPACTNWYDSALKINISKTFFQTGCWFVGILGLGTEPPICHHLLRPRSKKRKHLRWWIIQDMQCQQKANGFLKAFTHFIFKLSDTCLGSPTKSNSHGKPLQTLDLKRQPWWMKRYWNRNRLMNLAITTCPVNWSHQIISRT